MTEPELFDGIKLLVNLLEHNLYSGMQGAIVECYSDKAYKFAVFCVRGSYRIYCRGDPPHTINIAQPLILSGRPASGKLFGI